MRWKRLLTVSPSMSATIKGSSAIPYGAFEEQKLPIPHAAGTVIAQGKTDETVTTPSGVRAWAGKAGDPFWIEPDVLHAVGHAFQDGTL